MIEAVSKPSWQMTFDEKGILPADELCLVALDTETGGFDCRVQAAFEIAVKVVGCSTGKIYATYQSVIKISKDEWKKAIPSALAVNKFTRDELESGQPKEKVSQDIQEIFKRLKLNNKNALFMCQNPSFDQGFFNTIVPWKAREKAKFPYHWLGLESMYHARRIDKLKTGDPVSAVSYSKDNIAKCLGAESEPKPHRALNGVNHLLELYEKMVGFPMKQHADELSSTVSV